MASNVVYWKVEPCPNDESGDWRAVAETSNEGGLIHVVVYGAGEYDTPTKLSAPVAAMLGIEQYEIAWEEVSEMVAPN